MLPDKILKDLEDEAKVRCVLLAPCWHQYCLSLCFAHQHSPLFGLHFPLLSQVLIRMRHPHIVSFLGLCFMPPCIITELCERGSLFDVLQGARNNPEQGALLTWPLRLQMVGAGCAAWVHSLLHSPVWHCMRAAQLCLRPPPPHAPPHRHWMRPWAFSTSTAAPRPSFTGAIAEAFGNRGCSVHWMDVLSIGQAAVRCLAPILPPGLLAGMSNHPTFWWTSISGSK